MERLVIVGASGHGREVLDVVAAAGGFEFLGFLDDGEVDAARLAHRAASLVGTTEALRGIEAHYLIGIADPAVRLRIDALATSWGREPATVVHPQATVASDNRLSPGVVVAAGARITTNVSLGRHAHVNVNASVSHDCELGAYVTVNPGAVVSGSVTVGEGALLGAGCVVRQGLVIGPGAVVGAGAAVVRDVAPGVTVVGVPAEPLTR